MVFHCLADRARGSNENEKTLKNSLAKPSEQPLLGGSSSGLSDWEKLFQALPKRLKTYQLPLWPKPSVAI